MTSLQQVKVSLIIVCYNNRRFIDKCISSVLNSDYGNFEVIFIDNGSTDGSYELVKKRFDKVRNLKIIRNRTNLGVAYARNLGYRMATGDIIVFLDSDTVVMNNTLTELIKVFESQSNIGAVQCKLVRLDAPDKIDSYGQSIDCVGYGYPDHLFINANELGSQREIFYADGAAFAIKKKVAEEVEVMNELFDSDYFPLYYEDVDLCWRIRLRGFSVFLQPTALVYHKRTASDFYKLEEWRIRSHCRNRYFTLMKNYKTKNLFKYLFFLVLLELLKSLILLTVNSKHSIGTIKAIFDCLRTCKRIWQKRFYVQRYIRRIPDSEILTRMRRVNVLMLLSTFRILYTRC